MKAIQFLGILLIITFCSCSGGGGKFLGKWKSTRNMIFSQDALLMIEKQGGQYIMSNASHPEQPIPLTYIEKNDMLTGNVQGEDVDIKYIDSSKHISFTFTTRSSRSYSRSNNSIEFEKVD